MASPTHICCETGISKFGNTVQPDPAAAAQKGMRTVRLGPGVPGDELDMGKVMAKALFSEYEKTHQLDPARLCAHKAVAVLAAYVASPRYEIVVPSDPDAAREAKARAFAEYALSYFVKSLQRQPPTAFPKSPPQPDPAAAAAARTQWEDKIRGFENLIVIVQCPDCERFLDEDARRWIRAEYRSLSLLAFCMRRFKLKNNLDGLLYLGRPAFTHDSRELGVTFGLLKTFSPGITLRHTHIVDFEVHYQFCEHCSSMYGRSACSSDDNLKSEPLDYPPFPPLLPAPSSSLDMSRRVQPIVDDHL